MHTGGPVTTGLLSEIALIWRNSSLGGVFKLEGVCNIVLYLGIEAAKLNSI